MVLSGILASGDLVGGIVAGVVVLAIVMMIAFRSFLTVVTEYQRAVFFRFGRIRAQAKGPGLIFRIPAVDRVVKVNLRVEVVDIPPSPRSRPTTSPCRSTAGIDRKSTRLTSSHQ